MKINNITTLAISEVMSSCGHWILYMGMITYVTFTAHGGIREQGLLFLSGLLSRMLWSLIWGHWLDKFNSKYALIAGYLYLAIITFGFVFINTINQACLMIAIWSIGVSLIRLSQQTLMVYLFYESNLKKANILIKQSSQLSNIIAPILGGAFVSILGFKEAMIVVSMLFLFIGLLVFRVKNPQKINIRTISSTKIHKVRDKSERPFKLLLLARFMSMSMIMLLDILAPQLLRDELNCGQGIFIFLVSIFCIGSLLPSLIFGVFKDLELGWYLITPSLFIIGLLPLSISLVFLKLPQQWIFIGLLFGVFLSGLGIGTNELNLSYIMQKISPLNSIGRFSGIFWTVSELSQLIMILAIFLFIPFLVTPQMFCVIQVLLINLLAVSSLLTMRSYKVSKAKAIC